MEYTRTVAVTRKARLENLMRAFCDKYPHVLYWDIKESAIGHNNFDLYLKWTKNGFTTKRILPAGWSLEVLQQFISDEIENIRPDNGGVAGG